MDQGTSPRPATAATATPTATAATPTAATATPTATPTATAAEAATALGDEMQRLLRLIHAWKQRAREDPGGGDRVLLARLVTCGPRRATDLAADTLLDLSTVSRQTRSLVDHGLVERRPDPEDRRGALLSATPAGVIAYQHFRDQRNQRLAHILDAWPAEDRYQLVRLFGRLNDDFAENRAELFGGPVGATAQTAADAAQQGENT
ncbi:MarR family winged helix-turn-helix transcriptional regulator [Streptacidiphilus sp. PAMC 29251]